MGALERFGSANSSRSSPPLPRLPERIPAGVPLVLVVETMIVQERPPEGFPVNVALTASRRDGDAQFIITATNLSTTVRIDDLNVRWWALGT
jgi:hypothetical protein